MSGQINLGTLHGDLIYNLTKREDVENIVEIGTWNGQGSTMCVIRGIIDSNKNKKFISIELYPEMYQSAKNYLESYKEFVELINGRIIDYEEVFWFDHSSIDFEKNEHAKLYYHQDMQHLKNSDNVSNKIPDKIDLLILDGGEYTTYPEWKKLEKKTKIVVLDDSAILKTNKIREEILQSNNYNILFDNLNERNGFSIFEKK